MAPSPAPSPSPPAAMPGPRTPDTPVLVLGASGFVGRALSERLGHGRHALRLGVRDPARAPPVPGAQVAVVDALDAAQLRAAVEGMSAVVYLVHSMAGPRGAAFERRDRKAASLTVKAAEAAGVERIVYLGGLGSGQELSPHLASRREVARLLASGKPAITHLRAAVIVGRGGASWEMLRQLVERLPVMVCPRWVSSRCQPIALRDVVEAIAACLDHPATAGRTFDLGGPDVLTYREMMEVAGEELLGRKPLIFEVPVLTPRLSAYWVDLVTDAPPALAHALIEGLRNDVVCRGPSLEPYLPWPPMGYREAVRATRAPAARARPAGRGAGAPAP